MNYDPELLLQLATLVEALPDNDVLLIEHIPLPDVSHAQLIEPLKLLVEAHLTLGTVQYADDRVVEVRITTLTPKGRRFLEHSRDKEWWGYFLRDARIDAAGLVTREGFMMALINHFPYP